MIESSVSVFVCPKCGFMTNRPISIKTHEALSCGVKLEHHDLNYKRYSKWLTLEVKGHLKLDVFI
ncbi:MAG TPA: hypothetical protein ENH82_14075 [bacterium]|nr:hypothetical protein [bacterium]